MLDLEQNHFTERRRWSPGGWHAVWGEPPRWRWLKPGAMWPSRSANLPVKPATPSSIIRLRRACVRFALRCHRMKLASAAMIKKRVANRPHRHPVNICRELRDVEFEKLTVRQWDAIFASNTRGPFLVSRRSAEMDAEKTQQRLSADRGKIINMGSLGGLRPWATHAHYAPRRPRCTC